MSKFGIAHSRASIYPSIIIGTVASPSLLSALFVLQATIAAVKDWERG